MTTKQPRQTKTPRQRAQEALDVAARVATRLGKQLDALTEERARVSAEHQAAVARRDYLKKHPDLAAPSTQPSTTSTGGTTR